MTTKHKRLDPIHPGEILLEDFMKPMGVSINRLSREIVVPPGRISAIVNGKRAITADTALELLRGRGTFKGTELLRGRTHLLLLGFLRRKEDAMRHTLYSVQA